MKDQSGASMNKLKCISVLSFVWAAFILGFFACKKNSSDEVNIDSSAYEWVTIDEFYIPEDYVEEFIKNDSAEKGLLPVQIKNYGNNTAVLRKFKGRNFAGPTEAQIKMMYNGLGEWKLIDLKYKNKEEKNIQRTILYVYVNGDWKVGDSGVLIK
jgi:hypothetical protein